MALSLPTDTPTEFTVARVEVKKTLPAKDGQKPATILKLGLIAPDGAKDWAEFFCRDGTTPPSEGSKETLVLTAPDNPAWALKASRPRSGGGGRRDPAQTKRIERMHAQEMSLRWLTVCGAKPSNPEDMGQLTSIIEWFVEDTNR